MQGAVHDLITLGFRTIAQNTRSTYMNDQKILQSKVQLLEDSLKENKEDREAEKRNLQEELMQALAENKRSQVN